MKWNHVGIKTTDVEGSLRFYCEFLGLDRLEDVEIMGKTFYFVGNDTIKIEIEAGNPGDTQADPRTETGLYHLSFTVDDLEAIIARCREVGVNILLEPFASQPDRKTAFIEGPDGVFLQLIQYRSA